MIDQLNNEEATGRGKAPAIAIFAYGRRGYAQAAENLALTLRERKDSKFIDPAEQVKVKRNDRLRIIQMDADTAAKVDQRGKGRR